MAKLEGFVNKLNTKSGVGKRGPWTLYSFILELADGTESPWVSYGFEQPPFKEGEYIAFETDEKDGRHNFNKGSGRKPANPPERAKPAVQGKAAPANAGASKAVNSASATVSGSTADRQTSIVMQHSQEMAITAVGILLSNDALPTSGAATKAGEAKRFSEIMAAFDKLTVKFYNDAATGRLLETVSDTVIDTAPDAALPTKKTTAAKDSPAANDDDMDTSGDATAATPGGF